MEDRQESQLPDSNDCKWVRAIDSNGKSIRISKSSLLSIIETILHLGRDNPTEGSVLITDNYANGNLLTFGQTFSYGSAYIGYCMKQEKNQYLSTTPIPIARSIFICGPDGLMIGTAPAQATPINEVITGLSWRKV